LQILAKRCGRQVVARPEGLNFNAQMARPEWPVFEAQRAHPIRNMFFCNIINPSLGYLLLLCVINVKTLPFHNIV